MPKTLSAEMYALNIYLGTRDKLRLSMVR